MKRLNIFKFPEKFRRKYIKNCGYDFLSTFFKVCFLEPYEKKDLPMCLANLVLNKTKPSFFTVGLTRAFKMLTCFVNF